MMNILIGVPIGYYVGNVINRLGAKLAYMVLKDTIENKDGSVNEDTKSKFKKELEDLMKNKNYEKTD